MRGNILAAILATFFGNPLTYVPIGIVSLQTGYWLPRHARAPWRASRRSFARKFRGRLVGPVANNVLAVFTPATADWGPFSRSF